MFVPTWVIWLLAPSLFIGVLGFVFLAWLVLSLAWSLWNYK